MKSGVSFFTKVYVREESAFFQGLVLGIGLFSVDVRKESLGRSDII